MKFLTGKGSEDDNKLIGKKTSKKEKIAPKHLLLEKCKWIL